MKKKKDSRENTVGRRSLDKLTPGMLIASGFVNLMGAPAKIFVQWGMIGFVVWIIGNAFLKIARELKGTTTLANIQIGLQAALSLNSNGGKGSPEYPLGYELLVYLVIGAILIAGVAVLYANRERKLRIQTIREMGIQITTLEKYFDAGRSTSGLTKTGETHPKDV